jgi:hypothetical protein
MNGLMCNSSSSSHAGRLNKSQNVTETIAAELEEGIHSKKRA